MRAVPALTVMELRELADVFFVVKLVLGNFLYRLRILRFRNDSKGQTLLLLIFKITLTLMETLPSFLQNGTRHFLIMG